MNAKQIIIAGTLLVSVATFAQKDELKALKKIYAKDEIKGKDLEEYKSLVNKVEPLAVEESDKVYAGFYKSMTPILEILALGPNATPVQMMKFVTVKSVQDFEKGLNATLDYEKKTGKKVQTDDINETIGSFTSNFLQYADALGKATKYKESSEVLYAIYKLNKTEPLYLYYTANYALTAKDYEASLKYFNELKAINYTGVKTLFFAKAKVNNIEDQFNTKKERDDMVKIGSHYAPREEVLPSKKAEIYKSIASILIEQDKSEEAKLALREARSLDPNDTSLILAEADMFYKLKDLEMYKKLVNEALEKNPNDVNLIFNLGVTNSNTNQLAEAEKFYRRVIELDPSYVNAYVNLSELYLRNDEKFVTEMNKLGNNEKDNKRYDVLSKERNGNFMKMIPLLEKAYELKPQDLDVKKSLRSIYKALDMTAKANALKD